MSFSSHDDVKASRGGTPRSLLTASDGFSGSPLTPSSTAKKRGEPKILSYLPQYWQPFNEFIQQDPSQLCHACLVPVQGISLSGSGQVGDDQILKCRGCSCITHKNCYYPQQKVTVGGDFWLCDVCQTIQANNFPRNKQFNCIICGMAGGLMHQVRAAPGSCISLLDENQRRRNVFCHCFCARFVSGLVLRQADPAISSTDPDASLDPVADRYYYEITRSLADDIQKMEPCSYCQHRRLRNDTRTFDPEIPNGITLRCGLGDLTRALTAWRSDWCEIMREEARHVMEKSDTIRDLGCLYANGHCGTWFHLGCLHLFNGRIGVSPLNPQDDSSCQPTVHALCAEHTATWDVFWTNWFGDHQGGVLPGCDDSDSDEEAGAAREPLSEDLLDSDELMIRTACRDPGPLEPQSDAAGRADADPQSRAAQVMDVDLRSLPQLILRTVMEEWEGVVRIANWGLSLAARSRVEHRAFGILRSSPVALDCNELARTSSGEHCISVCDLDELQLLSYLTRFAAVGYGWLFVSDQQDTLEGESTLSRERLAGYRVHISSSSFHAILLRSDKLSHIPGLPAHIVPFRGLPGLEELGGHFDAREAATPGSQVSFFGMGLKCTGKYQDLVSALERQSGHVFVALLLVPRASMFPSPTAPVPSSHSTQPAHQLAGATAAARVRIACRNVRQTGGTQTVSYALPGRALNAMGATLPKGLAYYIVGAHSHPDGDYDPAPLRSLEECLTRINGPPQANFTTADVILFDIHRPISLLVPQVQLPLLTTTAPALAAGNCYSAVVTGRVLSLLNQYGFNTETSAQLSDEECEQLRAILCEGPLFVALDTHSDRFEQAFVGTNPSDTPPLLAPGGEERDLPVARVFGFGLGINGLSRKRDSVALHSDTVGAGALFVDLSCRLTMQALEQAITAAQRAHWRVFVGPSIQRALAAPDDKRDDATRALVQLLTRLGIGEQHCMGELDMATYVASLVAVRDIFTNQLVELRYMQAFATLVNAYVARHLRTLSECRHFVVPIAPPSFTSSSFSGVGMAALVPLSSALLLLNSASVLCK